MKIQNFSDTYENLRKQYPVFTYHSFSYSLENNTLSISFHFSIGKNIHFNPSSIILFHPLYENFFKKNIPSDLENIIFHIGMIELISYWKCTCSPTLVIKTGMLSKKAIKWWKKIYFHGLGEFFYCNGIETNIENFMDIQCKSDKTHTKQNFVLHDETIIPIGGGKDSVVTLELLKNHSTSPIPMVINIRGAISSCLNIAGFKDNFFEIRRTIHPKLLELNNQGFLNGHTPFSAMLAFYSVLIAVLSQKRNIALSNESSANESTVQNSDVNHQYSKSIAFENDFRNYVHEYINESINYYSFLRPLSEMQIALLFSRFPDYFPVFRSCNSGSKNNSWCCNCPKCLFTYIILSPFITPANLSSIFGMNLFENKELIPLLNELTGETEVKPFECVGTREEVCIALCEAIKKYDELPALLAYFKKTSYYDLYKDINITSFLSHFEKNHNVSKPLLKQIEKEIYNYTNNH